MHKKLGTICYTLMFACIYWGCNLMIDGHFLPDDFLPYAFLILLFPVMPSIKEVVHRLACKTPRRIFFIIFLATFLFYFKEFFLQSQTYTLFFVFKLIFKTGCIAICTSIIFLLFWAQISALKRLPYNIFIIVMPSVLIYFYLTTESSIFTFFPVILSIILCLNFNILLHHETNFERIVFLVTSTIFSIFQLAGDLPDYKENEMSLSLTCIIILTGLITWYYIFQIIFHLLFNFMDNLSFKISRQVKYASSRKAIFTAFVLLMLIRIAFFCNWFPGLISKDTLEQIREFIGATPPSNHQPWLHTLFIGFFLKLGQFLHIDYQISIAIFSFFSLTVMSLILLAILNYYKTRLPLSAWLILSFLYIFDPIHCIYTLNVGKDAAFAYAAVAFSFILIRINHKYESNPKISLLDLFLLVLSGTLFSLLRSNGLYAWLFTVPFLLYFLRKNAKPLLGALCFTAILIFFFKGILLPYNNIKEPDLVESLSVPLQQISYTINHDGRLSDEDYAFLSNIVDVDSLGDVYDPHISDWVKNLIRNKGNQNYLVEHKSEFIHTYFSIGIKNPYNYLLAFFNQSKGYWHHKMSNYIYYDGVHDNDLGLKRSPLLPLSFSLLMDSFMTSFTNVWHRIWSLNLNTYMLLFLFAYAIIRKQYWVHFLPILGVFITLVIATPVNDEFRYAYAIYLALPLLLFDTICPKGK